MLPASRNSFSSRALSLALSLLAFGVAAAAHAQSAAPVLAAGNRVAILPSDASRGHATAADRAKRARATGAVVAELRRRGFELLADDSVRNTLDHRMPDGCRDAVTCDPEAARQALAADATVAVAFWPAPAGPAHLVLYIRHKDGYGQAEVTAADGDIEAAARQAVEQALADSQQGHDVHVRIESDPPGATVRVDQALIGTAPVTLSLPAGNHLVTVETPGYVSDTHYVEVPAQAQDGFVHRITMVPAQQVAADPAWVGASPPAADGGSANHRDTRGTVHATDYVVASVLAAVALPLLGNGVYAAARNGECTGQRDSAGHCSERVTAGTAMWASLGLGIAALAGAATVIVFEPFSPSASTHPSGASLSLRTKF
ncbi:MAG TPA: PEGA domain-containing protein [Polyangiales bacterium]